MSIDRAHGKTIVSRILSLMVCVCLSTAAVSTASAQDGTPFADARAQELVLASLALRFSPEPALAAEAVVRNRTRVRLELPGQWKWRMRTLYRKEAVGRMRYETADELSASTSSRRRGAPLIGDGLLDRRPMWGQIGFDPEGGAALFGLLGLELAEVTPDVPLALPSVFGLFGRRFPDPLGPEGPAYYRYALGRILTTPEGRQLEGVEFRSTVGTGTLGLVWFDAETGAPVRVLGRPASRVPLRTGLRGPVRSLPLIEKDAVGEVNFLLIDYEDTSASGYQPTRIRIDGRILTFWGQAVLPVHSEWLIDWGPPPGRLEPPPPIVGVGTFADAISGLTLFVRELDRLSGPPPPPSPLDVATATVSSARFNQVQGVNFEVSYPIPVGAWTTLQTRLMIPTTSFEWTGSVGLERGRFPTRSGVELFSGLQDADPLREVNGALSSISALLTGYDDGNYYLARGGRAWVRFGELPVSGFFSVFGERHEVAARRAFYSLLTPDPSEEGPADIPVDEGNYFGMRTQVQLQFGEDPQSSVLLLRLHGQAATGVRDFVTLGTTTDLVSPLPGPFTLGLRLEAGVSGGRVPGQASYYLGGVRTVRGYSAATASGPSVLLLNAEIGTDLPLARLVAFADVGWTDSVDRLFSRAPLSALGGGISIGDGIVRLDVARGLTEAGGWRMTAATSGIF